MKDEVKVYPTRLILQRSSRMAFLCLESNENDGESSMGKAESRSQNSGVRRKEKGGSLSFWLLDSDS
jgi:hypothetical protein